MEEMNRFREAAAMLPPFKNSLQNVPGKIAGSACEIRVRTGRPVVVETPAERHVCAGTKATADDILNCIRYFCDYSIYSFEKELSEGWITLRGGHRAGFTGTAVVKNGIVTTIKDISSIDLRIAAEHRGIAEKLMSLTVFERDFRGLAILGPPLSAKTTMLRDYARLLSSFARTAIIDERGEIAAVYGGVPQNDIGLNSDVLDHFPKETGIMQALRSLSPEYLICDEVGTEYEQLAGCAGKGVKLIVTAHCGSIAEASCNRAVSFLIDSGAVNYISLQQKGSDIGNITGLWRVDKSEHICGCGNGNDLYRGRNRILVASEAAL